MRALLALAVLVALLGPLVPVEATFGDNGLTTFTGRARQPNTLVFGNDMVTEQATQATLHFAKDVLKGTWKPVRNDPPTEKREVELECLNSVAPAPLNWKMWCPGTDAKVVGWMDKSGAAHRQITLRPQAGMTSTMYQWFITTTVLGLMPPIVEFQGNHYHYYHLWHPLDHVESTWSLAPKVPILQKGMPVYVLIHERYRNPANFTYDRHYETNGWFYVEDAVTNLMKNRYVITMPYWGIPTWTMILEFNDTPEGLVVDVEVIAGVPHKGYDDRAPRDGYKMAAGMNELFTAPLLARQKGSYDWEESINAITRHVIEEFSNLQHFVPYLYSKCTLLGKAGLNWMPTLGTWLQQNNASVADSASVSFYNNLEKLAAMQVPKNGTLQGKLIDAQFDIINKTLLAGQNLLTKANEGLSRKTFVPLSNTLTALSHNIAQQHGAHPEANAPPKAGIKGFWDKMLNASEVTTTTETVVIDHGMLHTILKGSQGTPAAVSSKPSAAGNASAVQQQPQPQQRQQQQQPQGKADAFAEDGEDGDEESDQAGGLLSTPPTAAEAPKALAPAPAPTPAPTPAPAATPAPQPAPAPAPAQPAAPAAEQQKAGESEDSKDEDDDDKEQQQQDASSSSSSSSQDSKQEDSSSSEEEEDDSIDDNAAWKLRMDLKKAAEEPASDTADDDSPDEEGAASRSAQLAAAYMDPPPKPHAILSAALGGAAAAAAANGSNGTNATAAVSAAPAQEAAAAIEVPGVALADTQATIRALDSKNVSGMLSGIKQDILAGLENHTISFHGSNNTLRLPESVLAAMAAKHALHKGVLSALLNKADLGLGSNVSVWTTPDAAFYPSADGGPAAAAGGAGSQGPSLNDKVLVDLALKTALSKGGPLAALMSNASSGGGANVSFLPVPHAVFAAIANGTITRGNASTTLLLSAPVPAAPAVNTTKPGLQGSLQRLGHSVQRAKRLAKSFKPALSLSMPLFGGNSSQGAYGGRNISDKSLQVKLKFWGDQGRP